MCVSEEYFGWRGFSSVRAWTVVDGVEGGAHEGGGGGAEGPTSEVLRHVLGHRRGLLAREDLAPWEGGQGPGAGR